jgi:hypothetical protein
LTPESILSPTLGELPSATPSASATVNPLPTEPPLSVLLDEPFESSDLSQSAAGSYEVELTSAGLVTLSRLGQVIGTAQVVANTPGVLRTLGLSAVGNLLRVSVEVITAAPNSHVRWQPTMPAASVFYNSAPASYNLRVSQIVNNTNLFLTPTLDCPVPPPPPPTPQTPWPTSGGVTVTANGIIPMIFQNQIPDCVIGSEQPDSRYGCAVDNLQFVVAQIGSIRWKDLVALSYYFEGDAILGSTPTTAGVLPGLGACTDNRGTASTPVWESGQQRNCIALQDEFRYAVVEYLFNMCTGAGTRLTYSHLCDEQGFRNYLMYSQGIYSWSIQAEHQQESQNPNSPFFNMTLSEYITAIVTKYGSQAEAIINSFSSYGVCPCSWVNDSFPTRGQLNGSTSDPNDYLASYSYVVYATIYGSHFKVY